MSKFYTIVLATVLALSACSQEKEQKNAASGLLKKDSVQSEPAPSPIASKEIKLETFPVEAGGYGYAIYIDGKKTINQTNIPSVAGNKGFSTEEKAKKAGEFFAEKLRNGQGVISSEELDSLGLLE